MIAEPLEACHENLGDCHGAPCPETNLTKGVPSRNANVHSASEACHRDPMLKPAFILAPLMLLASGCASAAAPGRSDLAAVIQTPISDIRALRCREIPEERTEFGCRYQRRDAPGVWVQQEVMLAIDGSAWVIIDGPGLPYRD